MTTDLISLPSFTPAYLAGLGIDVQRLLRAAKLPATLFLAGKAWVNTREYFALWWAIEGMGVPRDFGLRVAEAPPPVGTYDVASVAALHSADFGEAVAKIARYKRLVCPGRWLLERQGGEASLEFRWLLLDDAPPDFLTDGAFAYVARLYQRGTGRPMALRRVELVRRRAQEDMLARHFRCAIRFNAPRDRMVFDAAALADGFQTHNPELLDLMLPGLEAALHERGLVPGWIDLARDAIGRRMQGARPTLQEVARELGVGPRSLQRRLVEAGTSYQQLLDAVRREVACRLLATTDLDPGEIAFCLGFEELNSLSRAFQGWEGCTPTQWRVARRRRTVASGATV